MRRYIKKRKKKSYIQRALELFQSRVRKIVTSQELAQLVGRSGKPISHNIRRIFELRDEEGYDIVNHKDNERTGLNLKVNEWVLLRKNPDPKKIRPRGVNKRIMFEVFTRDGYQCQFCGLASNDDDPFRSGHKVKLHVGHIIAHKKERGKDFVKIENIQDMDEIHKLTKDDFITMCNVCNEGAKNKNLKILSPVEKVLKLNKKAKKKIFEALSKEFL